MSDLTPSIVTLRSRTWTKVFVPVSSIVRPISRGTGASATVPAAEVLYWPGDQRPTDSGAVLRSQGPGICYLWADSAAPAGMTPWWLYYDHASDTIEVNVIPVPLDSEFAVYALGYPGWTAPSVHTSVALTNTTVTTLANPNPDRKYLAISITDMDSGFVTLGIGGTNPSATLGITLRTRGSLYEMYGDNLYRGIIEGRWSATGGGSGASVTIIEGI